MKVYFARTGILAIAASGLSDMFEPAEPAPLVLDAVGVAVVQISGPLTNHAEPIEHGQPCFDSYDAIRARVAAALISPARAVVMQINSPGGEAAGCFELSADLRAMADQCGKRLYAYADGMAASAAYAIACGAHEIYTSVTGTIGSVGVVTTMADVTAADAAAGLRIELVTSGARKADGNVHAAITDEAIAALQERVTDLAEIFFELVATSRGIPVASVRSLEAGIFHGTKAKANGLVNGVCSFAQLLAIAGGMSTASAAAKGTQDMNLMQMLQAVIDGDGSDEEKALAKKALAAISAEESDEDEKKTDEDKAEGDDEPAAEGDDDAPPTKKDDDEAKAAASIAARVLAIEESAERNALFASRPDLVKDAGTKAFLSGLPIAHLRAAVKTIKRAPVPKLAGAASAAGTAGAREGAGTSPEAHQLDVAMGLRRGASAFRHEGTRSFIGVMRPAEAKAEIARRAEVEKQAGIALKGAAQ